MAFPQRVSIRKKHNRKNSHEEIDSQKILPNLLQTKKGTCTIKSFFEKLKSTSFPYLPLYRILKNKLVRMKFEMIFEYSV